MDLLQAIIIAIVEGLTEYLPISSTAHMIFTRELMGLPEDDFFKIFALCIQFGAILAVVTLYWRKFLDFSKWQFYLKLICAVLPALILGKLLDDYIDSVMGAPVYIAIMLIIGGIVLLFIDRFFQHPTILHEKDISIKKAVIIGLWQCLAMMPGTSRSAASIIGGMQQKLSRELAAEFSFFLAVPTMLAVTVYSLFLKHYQGSGESLKGYQLLADNSDKLSMFLIGNIVAYIVAILAIKGFVNLIKKYGFSLWGYYRIIVGGILLIFLLNK
jgi:undecaprenyl-diphosphatase